MMHHYGGRRSVSQYALDLDPQTKVRNQESGRWHAQPSGKMILKTILSNFIFDLTKLTANKSQAESAFETSTAHAMLDDEY